MMNLKSLRFITLHAVVAITLAFVMPANAQQILQVGDDVKNNIKESTNGIYIVQMLNKPVVAYEGDINGLKATKPAQGKKINPNSPAVVNYASYLADTHDAVIARVNAKKVYDYHYTFNGFAAEMTVAQANKMMAFDRVIVVSPDTRYYVNTSSTPEFLDLTAEDGLWNQLGGAGSAGEGIIIGIIDTGIWPESLSFSDRTGTNGNASKDGKLDYKQISGWHGKCLPGESFPASDCNQKLIGAQWFNESFGGDAGIDADYPWEFNSARDYGGHGTHTASTAGGNNNVPVTGAAAVFGSISGIAPHASIAVYKALWEVAPGQGSGFTGDLVAAIDQAVADGVDVINYSISGSRTSFMDPIEIAFLFATDAGIFVAASAGNSGPDAFTVAHPSPWITTAAASTHDRYFEGSVTLGNGDTYHGASLNTTGVDPADLVYAGDAGDNLCNPGLLDSTLVIGKIVLCDRGLIARVSKSEAVYKAGGIGMILANTVPSSLNADFHSVPTVHVGHVDGDAIRDYTTTDTSPSAEIFESIDTTKAAPDIAGFSSRGPLLAGSGDILKPDVSAPGVDILASVAPPGNGGKDFDLYSGTSMSSPHVAGLAALLMDRHPNWTPMMIKSALMTTGFDLLSGADPFAQGAGHVAPTPTADPGLVYNSGWVDWLGFLCGTGDLSASFCSSIGIDPIDPSDLNLASFAIGALPGTQTVTRTVTNVTNMGHQSESYTFEADIPGIDVVANPASFSLNPGESQNYTLTFTVDGADINSYAKGFVTWAGDTGHVVRSPVAVRPVVIAVPAEITGSGSDGSHSFDVSFGYTGDYAADVHGLVAAEIQTDKVADDPADDINTALGTCDWSSFPYKCIGITWHTFEVPAGTSYARFALFDAYTDGADDLDLYVWGPTGYVGGSGSGTSLEDVGQFLPAAGIYEIAVHGWGTDGPDASYTLFNWAVPATAGSSNMSVTGAPAAVVQGNSATLTVDWTGLNAGTKYLGAISHNNGGSEVGSTLISISTE